MKDKLLISFSGGRTSAYMTWWLMHEWPERDKWDMKVVFANTGKEDERTLTFVKECDIRWGLGVVWVEANVHQGHGEGTTATVVSYKTASRKGEPFEAVIKKYGIPNQAYPHCTRELKQRPIHSYIKSIGWSEYYTAIGIRVDEFDRMNPDRRNLRFMYPLVSNNVSLKDVMIVWGKQDFDLGLESYEGNCDLCWKKSTPKLRLICDKSPGKMTWWQEMEEKYGRYIPESRQHNQDIQLPIRFFRGNKTIAEIASAPKDPYTQADLFEFGCSESCEPF